LESMFIMVPVRNWIVNVFIPSPHSVIVWSNFTMMRSTAS